jgi:signal transduction histidine kinase
VVDQLGHVTTDLRRNILALKGSPPTVSSHLSARADEICGESARTLGFPPRLVLHGPVDHGVPEDVAVDLTSVLREALSNVARHAHASSVEVRLSVADSVCLEVLDDGVGVGHPSRLSGLANLEQRALEHHGRFLVVEPAGGGTQLSWSVPLPRSTTQEGGGPTKGAT